MANQKSKRTNNSKRKANVYSNKGVNSSKKSIKSSNHVVVNSAKNNINNSNHGNASAKNNVNNSNHVVNTVKKNVNIPNHGKAASIGTSKVADNKNVQNIYSSETGKNVEHTLNDSVDNKENILIKNSEHKISNANEKSQTRVASSEIVEKTKKATLDNKKSNEKDVRSKMTKGFKTDNKIEPKESETKVLKKPTVEVVKEVNSEEHFQNKSSSSSIDALYNESVEDIRMQVTEELERKQKFWNKFDLIERILVVVLAVAILTGAFMLYQNMTSVRVARALTIAEAAESSGDYQKAVENYKKALAQDGSSLVAYQKMANCYVSLGDNKEVEKTLYAGWQSTHNQGLLENYVTVRLNNIMTNIENNSGTFDNVNDVVEVLKLSPNNANAIGLLNTMYDRYMVEQNQDGENVVFWSFNGTKSSFDKYADAVDAMLNLYDASPSEEFKAVIQKYMIPEGTTLWVDLDNCKDYASILEQAQKSLGENSTLSSLEGCLNDAADKNKFFSSLYKKLSEKDVSALIPFVLKGDVIKLKSELEQGEDNYLVLSHDQKFSGNGIVVKLNTDNVWTYQFVDEKNLSGHLGVMSVELSSSSVLRNAQKAKSSVDKSSKAGTSNSLEVEIPESGQITVSYLPPVNDKHDFEVKYILSCDYRLKTNQDNTENNSKTNRKNRRKKNTKVTTESENSASGSSSSSDAKEKSQEKYEGVFTLTRIISHSNGRVERTIVNRWAGEKLELIEE